MSEWVSCSYLFQVARVLLLLLLLLLLLFFVFRWWRRRRRMWQGQGQGRNVEGGECKGTRIITTTMRSLLRCCCFRGDVDLDRFFFFFLFSWYCPFGPRLVYCFSSATSWATNHYWDLPIKRQTKHLVCTQPSTLLLLWIAILLLLLLPLLWPSIGRFCGAFGEHQERDIFLKRWMQQQQPKLKLMMRK